MEVKVDELMVLLIRAIVAFVLEVVTRRISVGVDESKMVLDKRPLS